MVRIENKREHILTDKARMISHKRKIRSNGKKTEKESVYYEESLSDNEIHYKIFPLSPDNQNVQIFITHSWICTD